MKIYLTFRNADMTEGSGPMIADKAFLHREHAVEYIDSQPGIMGVKRKWSEVKYAEWEVREVEVIEYSLIDYEKKIKEETEATLSILSEEQKELLRKYFNQKGN